MHSIHPRKFAPQLKAPTFAGVNLKYIDPFFTNTNETVYGIKNMPPELVGALCSRTSRATGDLREIFWLEYAKPLSEQVAFDEFCRVLSTHSPMLSDTKARDFYSKWLAQYGDDSIAQMAGFHVVYQCLSQLAIKHIEDQRIGIAPIEKSTRYTDFTQKIDGQYQYYIDPTIQRMGPTAYTLYLEGMDGLFTTFSALKPRMEKWLQDNNPDVKPNVIEKKAFDCLRGLFPMSLLSSVATFTNGQACEYLIARSVKHPLGEVRWLGERTMEVAHEIAPSFVRRLLERDADSGLIPDYMEILGQRKLRIADAYEQVEHNFGFGGEVVTSDGPSVQIPMHNFMPSEDEIITAMLFSAPQCHFDWDSLAATVACMTPHEKSRIIASYIGHNRTQRWQRIGRAFENVYVRFDILMNIGAWRDLQRHRMQSQQRQNFTINHGYDVPKEVSQAGYEEDFRFAINRAEDAFREIHQYNPEISQYAVTMAHRVRFFQYANLRELFWEIELRTGPDGHPDYRLIEQMKFKELAKYYPLTCEFMLVNMLDYDFARRGTDDQISLKQAKLDAMNQSKKAAH